MNTWTLSAWTDGGALEVPFTRQVVNSEADARRIVIARNRHEHSARSSMRWAYYPTATPALACPSKGVES